MVNPAADLLSRMGNQDIRKDPEGVLLGMGLALPVPAAVAGAYVPTKRVGNLLYVSGQIPVKDGKVMMTGVVGGVGVVGKSGGVVGLEDARACAVQCTLNALAAVKAAVGNLSVVKQVVRVGCFVACEDGFGEQPKVANAASELLAAVFGESGRHVRAAVGTNNLPLNVPVEIEYLFEV